MIILLNYYYYSTKTEHCNIHESRIYHRAVVLDCIHYNISFSSKLANV